MNTDQREIDNETWKENNLPSHLKEMAVEKEFFSTVEIIHNALKGKTIKDAEVILKIVGKRLDKSIVI